MQLNLVAVSSIIVDTKLSKKNKLLEKLKASPSNFTWDEATKLMNLCNFKLINKKGSARMFAHINGAKVRLHEPHPQNTLLPYMANALLEGLNAAGELEK